jgi:hypothetical protein
MLRWYPYVPIGGELALNCAILSYDGMVYFGFSGDAHAAPHLNRLETFLKLSFIELCEAAGVRQKTQKSPAKISHSTRHTRTSPEPAATSAARTNSTPQASNAISSEPGPLDSSPTPRPILKAKSVLLQQTA